MKLVFTDYQDVNIQEVKKNLELCTEADINLQPKNKMCLFVLGMLFVKGIPIKILNENELDLTATTKSFSMMPYVWSKIGDKSFPNKDYSNLRTEMDERIENIKRLGVGLSEIKNHPTSKKIFLICPVRNATPEQRKWIEDFTRQKEIDGYQIHAPHLHTRQVDLFGGYTICKKNEEAVAASEEIDLYYDQSSTGSVFDLGAAYQLEKPLKVLNKDSILWNPLDPIDEIISNWPFLKDTKIFVKK